MNAQDIMTSGVIAVSPADTVRELARVLTEGGISGAPVLDREGLIVGIVSEADVISKRGDHVEDVMQRAVITVDPDMGVEQVCDLMSRHGINRVPVVTEGRVVGIITRSDVVRAIAGGSLTTDLTAPETSSQQQA